MVHTFFIHKFPMYIEDCINKYIFNLIQKKSQKSDFKGIDLCGKMW